MRFCPGQISRVGVAIVTLSAIQPHGWPVIEQLSASVTYTHPGRDGADTPFLAKITDSADHPVYRVECHSGNYDDDSKLAFADDFQCGLFSEGADTATETNVNLLASATRNEQSTDWFNRGRMLAAQLKGQCGGYPEYGAIRHFRLRGMLVTFRFTNMEWAAQESSGLERFTFNLSVVPDKGAQTSTAEAVHVPKPPDSCAPVE